MSETKQKKINGVLHLLVNRVRDGDALDMAQPLAWAGCPPDASWSDTVDDLDLGDYDCDPVDALPSHSRGLWLLEWPWREVNHPEYAGATTAKYAATGTWRRPTVADLVALGVLPENTA